jgi:hypothetical protein
MINARKLQYYTMAHRMRGYAEGLDEYKHEALVHMLMTSAAMLEEVWDEYNSGVKNNGVNKTKGK